MKQKMDDITKAKLIYSIELGVFSVAFLVIAILQFVRVITFGETHLRIINWITIFGASFTLLDFVWFLKSPIRRKKNSMLDKCLIFPLAVYVLVFDIICFANYEPAQLDLAQLMIPIASCYASGVYCIEAIYHWFHPVPLLLEEIEKEKNKENHEDAIDTNVEEIKEDNKEEN